MITERIFFVKNETHPKGMHSLKSQVPKVPTFWGKSKPTFWFKVGRPLSQDQRERS